MKIFKKLLSSLVVIIILASLSATWIFRQEIFDWWSLRDYQPPVAVEALATKTTMTPKAKRIFYVNRPLISSATEFNAECSQETSIVLGCYALGKGIFLYDINDPRLAGVKEVTAAHEMLHAAYDRLSQRERVKVDGLTQSAYLGLSDERIKANVEKYRKQDPQVVASELHSILATEVRQLPSGLEDYYKEYFTDRHTVVALSEHYEAEFTNRNNQVDQYDRQLAELKIRVDGLDQELSLQRDALTTEKSRLDDILKSGDVAGYNQNVASFNSQVRQYNVSVRNAENLIAEYNTLVEKRNSVALEVKDMAQAIDSRPQTL